jgi:hypothetical protein
MVDEISDKVRIAIETWDNQVDKLNEYSDEARDKRRREQGRNQTTSKPLENGCCTICGEQFVYKRHGPQRLTCSAECNKRRCLIWNRAYDKKYRASAVYKAKRASAEYKAKRATYDAKNRAKVRARAREYTHFRLPPELRARIDEFRAAQPITPPLNEAIRYLIDCGLAAAYRKLARHPADAEAHNL